MCDVFVWMCGVVKFSSINLIMTGTELPGAECIPGAKTCIAVPRAGNKTKTVTALSERQLEPRTSCVGFSQFTTS